MQDKFDREDIKDQIRNINDFPSKGVQFKDITPVLAHPELFKFLVEELKGMYSGREITKVVGIESRGFILGGAIAAALGAAFVPIIKKGKLPGDR